jgi:hypothetical protein
MHLENNMFMQATELGNKAMEVIQTGLTGLTGCVLSYDRVLNSVESIRTGTRITRIGRIYTDPGAQRLEKAPEPDDAMIVCLSRLNNHREHRVHREKRQGSVLSVYSVVDQVHIDPFYQNKSKNNKPQMNADKRRLIAMFHREERKAEDQISLRSGMKIINNELVRTPYELTLPEFVSVCFSSLFFPDRIYRIDRMVE